MKLRVVGGIGVFVVAASMMVSAQSEAPTGSPSEATGKEKKLLEDFKGKLNGKIVWSTSRVSGKHDIWIMNADGTDQKALTKSDCVDWFPRFSPDGSKVVFTRSVSGWVGEMDAEIYDKWNIWTINTDGTDEKKVADNASWGSWRPDGETIVYARGPRVFTKNLTSGEEKEIFDSEVSLKKGTYSQEPQMSPNGNFLAITVRGSDRQTGIWNFAKKEWYTTGPGCEITWFPDNKAVVRMNEGHGNGGTEVLKIPVDADGKPTVKIKGVAVPKELKFMDLPIRRSHEYFPHISNDGVWMVWGATQYGHDHDIYDYEIFVWKIGDKPDAPVRLTFHTGNDRWPDLFVAK